MLLQSQPAPKLLQKSQRRPVAARSLHRIADRENYPGPPGSWELEWRSVWMFSSNRQAPAGSLQQHRVDPRLAVPGRGSRGGLLLQPAEKAEQLLLRPIEEPVQQLADGGTPHLVARRLGGVDKRTANLAARQLA